MVLVILPAGCTTHSNDMIQRLKLCNFIEKFKWHEAEALLQNQMWCITDDELPFYGYASCNMNSPKFLRTNEMPQNGRFTLFNMPVCMFGKLVWILLKDCINRGITIPNHMTTSICFCIFYRISEIFSPKSNDSVPWNGMKWNEMRWNVWGQI